MAQQLCPRPRCRMLLLSLRTLGLDQGQGGDHTAMAKGVGRVPITEGVSLWQGTVGTRAPTFTSHATGLGELLERRYPLYASLGFTVAGEGRNGGEPVVPNAMTSS